MSGPAQKFVIRLLTEDGVLLAWAEEHLVAQSGGRYVTSVTRLHVEQAGTPALISIHWCDADIARTERLLLKADPVEPGQVLEFHWFDSEKKNTAVWDQNIHKPMSKDDVPLPAVTIRQSIAIGVPPMGAR